MKRILHTFFVIALLVVHGHSATALTSDTFKEEIEGWQEVRSQEQQLEGWIAEDLASQESEELYPRIEGELTGSRLEQQRQERASEFVLAEVSGVEVIFRDVTRREWFAPYVRSVLESHVMSGYRDAEGRPTGEFGPANSVSIEELAKVSLLLAGVQEPDCPEVPKNLTASGSWSARYVACAEVRGLDVFTDGAVDVKRPATRAEVIVTLLQALKVSFAAEPTESFTDVPATVQFAGAIQQAKKDGIVIGYTTPDGELTGMFGPSDPVKRAELAKILTLTASIYAER